MIVKVKLADRVDIMSKIVLFENNNRKLTVTDQNDIAISYRVDEVLEYEIYSKGTLIESHERADDANREENEFNEEFGEYLDGTKY